MANTLKIKRGTAATIPQGQLAEPLFTTDTYDLYIGKGSGGNQRIQNYIASGTSSQFLKGDGSLDSTTYQATSEKGQNNGYASLDAGGKIPASQLPSSVIEYKGTWNASTNTPTLADGTGDAGDVYIVSVGGTQNLGSGSITFDAGDWVMYNGSVWQKSTGSNAVASVNGQTGIVSIGVNDLDDATITSVSNGQLLQYSTGTNKWVNWTPTYISAAITSLNGLTAATQTFAVGTSGTDFAVSSSTSTHTFNLPDASASARGVVTTATQTFAGNKTFSDLLYGNQHIYFGMSTGADYYVRTPNVSTSRRGLFLSNGVNTDLKVYAGGTQTLGAWTESDTTLVIGTGYQGGGGSNETILFHSTGIGNMLALSAANSRIYAYLPITASSSITATSFVKSGGTSAQFLKADGSVDSNTYLTTSSASSTYVPYSGANTNVNLGIYGLTAGVHLIANYNDQTPGASASRDVIQANTSFTPSGTTNVKTDWKNFNASFTINTTGTLTNYYGYYATAPTVTSGTITNKYSFYGASGAGIGYFADGMTLAGALSGTSASFSGNVNAARFTPTGATIPTVGMYSSASNYLDFSTNGTRAITISDGQKVGIGADPISAYRLYVNGDIYASATVYGSSASFTSGGTFGGSISATTALFNQTSNQLILQNVNGGTNAEKIAFFMNSNDTFKILSLNDNNTTRVDNILVANVLNGNVGIGTTSPNTFLHVFGSNTSNRGQLSIQSNNTSNAAKATWYYDTFNSGEIGTTSSDFYALATNNFLFYASGAERMRITSGGNVLIGTTDNTAAYRLNVSVNGGSAYMGVTNQAGGSGDRYLRIGFGTGATVASIQGTRVNVADDVNLALQPDGGNVGIGTNPSYKLDVSLPSGSNGQIIRMNRSAGAYGWGIGIDSANSNFNFYNNGGTSVANINNSTGAYTATSDMRVKENIIDSNSAINKINNLKVRQFNWKESGVIEQYGLIAQEVYEVLPSYVTVGDENTNWGVSRESIVPFLIKAIQELKAELDTLKNK